ncbi:LysR family transcriptional regulator [Aquitalea denitrificans]|uniref:LysR family transcriptional regulator n=1 Tax=Aquitalea denitrificans TaxID=519081 RepID=UPI00135B0271|nr:LysR family transcriptional regulator [Aquitalea denitrificans]
MSLSIRIDPFFISLFDFIDFLSIKIARFHSKQFIFILPFRDFIHMIIRPPNIQSLQTFLMLSECNSFTEAAERLHLTQSAVSRQIQLLEEHYSVTLFNRSARKVELTAEGIELLRSTEMIFRELSNVEKRYSRKSRPFRLKIYVSLAAKILLPLLPQFCVDNPGLSLMIETESDLVYGDLAQYDAFVSYKEKSALSQDDFLLFEECLIPVCHPQCVAGKVPPQNMDQLSDYTLLHGSLNGIDWERWTLAYDQSLDISQTQIFFNLDELAIEAALHGVGVAMVDKRLVQPLLDSKRLLVPMEAALTTNNVYVLSFKKSGAEHPHAPVVKQWLRQHLCQ